jgi:hypothetical protein
VQAGSIGADDIESRLSDVETRLEIESAADEEVIAGLVGTAERMCFMMDAIRNPHPLTSTVTLNGSPLAGAGRRS